MIIECGAHFVEECGVKVVVHHAVVVEHAAVMVLNEAAPNIRQCAAGFICHRAGIPNCGAGIAYRVRVGQSSEIAKRGASAIIEKRSALVVERTAVDGGVEVEHVPDITCERTGVVEHAYGRLDSNDAPVEELAVVDQRAEKRGWLVVVATRMSPESWFRNVPEVETCTVALTLQRALLR